MIGQDLFGLYRTLLALVLCVYLGIRVFNFADQVLSSTASAGRRQAMALQYLVIQLLRIRVRRFALDLVQVAVLLVVFAYVLSLHWSWAPIR